MVSSEKVQRRIVEWRAAEATRRRVERGIEPARGYDSKYACHEIEHEHAANEARAAASLAKEFLNEDPKPPD